VGSILKDNNLIDIKRHRITISRLYFVCLFSYGCIGREDIIYQKIKQLEILKTWEKRLKILI